jgi:hypothetical protein
MTENRSKKAMIGELLAWAAVAIITALILVVLSERFLPASF